MATLLLRLAGPLQSWGDSSRFNQRATRTEPTKSGVLGLLASATGRRRTDPIEDLLQLKFGVRTEQPGTMLRDFQTEIDWRTGKSKALTHRYYLADAVFLAGVEADEPVVDSLHEALLHPKFPLFLGRRSCPPSDRLVVGIRQKGLVQTLRSEPWRASRRYMAKQPKTGVRLPIIRDVEPGEESQESVHDVPISFDPMHREFGWRGLVHEYSDAMDNRELGRGVSHDPMQLVRMANVSDKA